MIKITNFDPAKHTESINSSKSKISARPSPESSSFNSSEMMVDGSVVAKLEQITDDTKNALRVYITGGGCSGFKYCFKLDSQPQEDDIVIDIEHQYKVVVDAMSISFLQGATLKWQEDLEGARFLVENPNAETTCSCGASFSLA